MLTRPGSEPGPERMRKLAGSPEGFRQIRKATSGIRVLFGRLQVASISVADFARLSRVWPARRRDAAAVPGRHRAQGYRPRRRCHRNCRYRRSERPSYRVRSNRRWRFLLRCLVAWCLCSGSARHRLAPVGALAFGHATLGAIGRYPYGLGTAFGYCEASGKQKESLFG